MRFDQADPFWNEVSHLTRAMTALTRSTEALIRATEETDFLSEVCRIAVDIAGYRLAWVGYVQDDAEKTVAAMASAGPGSDYIRNVTVSWDDNDHGRGPTGTAIRTNSIQVMRDIGTDDRFRPWRDLAIAQGFAASIALPLTDDDRVFGVLSIYSSEHGAFDEREVSLLGDLARHLSYGISMLRVQIKRREAERELRESEERYRSLVELSPDAILVQCRGIIVFANAAANLIFRSRPGDELAGRPAMDIVHEDDREFARAHLSAATPAPLADEKLRRLDGEVFHGDVVAVPVIYQGRQARQVVIRDVTERKQVQAQLIQTAKLANLGEMAAGMAHELSQPINIIRMGAEGALLLTDRGKATPEYQRNQFELISAQAGRMAEIIDHIRIFSRKEAGKVVTFDAALTMRQAIQLIERQLRAEDIALDIDIEASPLPVRGRPVHLEQVVINLISNAEDAVRERRGQSEGGPQAARQGHISVRARRATADSIHIRVTDNGTGIPAAHLDRVFEPFFTTKEAGRGTGLGLSISFGLISSMGGTLSADATDNGACFSIVLPLADDDGMTGPPASKRDEASPRSGPAGRRILLVEDEPIALRTMVEFFSDLGYRVSGATDGVEALRIYVVEPADLVITDLRMPGGGGEDLIEALRRRQPTLPIIVVTGHVGVTEEMSLGIDCVVMKKPVSLKILGERVAEMIGR